MYYANKGQTPMAQCRSRVYADHMRQSLKCESKGAPATLEPRQQQFEVLQCECLADYADPPLMDFFYTYVSIPPRLASLIVLHVGPVHVVLFQA